MVKSPICYGLATGKLETGVMYLTFNTGPPLASVSQRISESQGHMGFLFLFVKKWNKFHLPLYPKQMYFLVGNCIFNWRVINDEASISNASDVGTDAAATRNYSVCRPTIPR